MNYKEILKGIVNIIKTTEKSDIGFANICSYIGENCPELKESEDERIRKDIIRYLKESIGDEDVISPWLTWLEMQGEQKPTSDTRCEVKNSDSLSVNGKPFDYEKATITQKDFAPKDYHSIDPHFGMSVEDLMSRKNPADKVEPFDKYEGLTDFERTLADICIGWIGEELGWKQYIKDNADVLLKIAIKKFNSIQDAPFEQKPAAWSYEDEKMYKIALSCIETLEDISNGKNMHADVKDWLKSLKERIGG